MGSVLKTAAIKTTMHENYNNQSNQPEKQK